MRQILVATFTLGWLGTAAAQPPATKPNADADSSIEKPATSATPAPEAPPPAPEAPPPAPETGTTEADTGTSDAPPGAGAGEVETTPAASAAEEKTTAAEAAVEPKDAAGPRVISETHTGMGTRLQIQVFAADEDEARQAIRKAFAEIARVEALLSEWRAESDVSRINQHAGKEAAPVSADTLQVLSRGIEINRLSKGAFALTWAALSSLWSFGSDAPQLPDPARLNARLKLVDDGRLTIDAAKKTAKLEAEGMAVGLGGIGKGYAIDRALAVLRDAGFPDALVFIGGDIGVSGSKADEPWVIGIQDPRAVGFFAVLAAKDEAVVTSGDYQHFFELDGKRYHHILDPRTGMPATSVRSATVVAKDALSADALATALFVLGPDEGMKLIESQPGVEGMIVDAKNEVTLTSGLKDRVRVVREPTD
jgi:thiamine biosynthesis lipoprotein